MQQPRDLGGIQRPRQHLLWPVFLVALLISATRVMGIFAAEPVQDLRTQRTEMTGSAPAVDVVTLDPSSRSEATTIRGEDVTFSWAPIPGAQHYRVRCGYKEGNMFYGSQLLDGSATRATFDRLPTNGDPIYVRLEAKVNDVWQLLTDHRFTTFRLATLTTPMPSDSLVPGDRQLFGWQPADAGADAYRIRVGTRKRGASNVFPDTITTGTTVEVSNLPSGPGIEIHTTLSTMVNGRWYDKHYVAAAHDPETSSNWDCGLNWVPGSGVETGFLGGSMTLRAVVYSPDHGVFAAVGDNGKAFTSSDGLDWTAAQTPIRGYDADIFGIGCGDRVLIAAARDERILRSANGGRTWDLVYDGEATEDYYDVAYGNGRFVVVGELGTVLVSADAGDNWKISVSAGMKNKCVAFGDGLFYRGGHGGIYSSPDGETWTRRGENVFHNLRCVQDLTLGPLGWIAAEKKAVYRSRDGTGDWSEIVGYDLVNGKRHAMPYTCFATRDAYFVAGDKGEQAADGEAMLLQSRDGIRWVRVRPGTSRILFGMASNRTHLVLVSDAKEQSLHRDKECFATRRAHCNSTGLRPPAIPTSPHPADRSDAVSLPVDLSVTVSDPNGDAMDVTFFVRDAGLDPEEFVVVVLPDTQFYPVYYPKHFASQMQWAVANKVACVIQVGDLVEYGDGWSDASAPRPAILTKDPDWEWAFVDKLFHQLDAANIPYLIAVGNHDQGRHVAIDDESTECYNRWFGRERYSDKTWFRGSRLDSENNDHFITFRVADLDFVLLTLEFHNREFSRESIEWADSILGREEYRNHRAIVVSHHVLNGDGSFANNKGQRLLDELSDHANLFMVLCGHTAREATRQDIGCGGQTVYTLLANYQEDPEGGNGYMRVLRFRPNFDEIQVSTHSPSLEAYETDGDSQFTLAYAMKGKPGGRKRRFQYLGTSRSVPSGSTAVVPWDPTPKKTLYEWFAVASDNHGNGYGEMTVTSSPVFRFAAAVQKVPGHEQ